MFMAGHLLRYHEKASLKVPFCGLVALPTMPIRLLFVAVSRSECFLHPEHLVLFCCCHLQIRTPNTTVYHHPQHILSLKKLKNNEQLKKKNIWLKSLKTKEMLSHTQSAKSKNGSPAGADQCKGCCKTRRLQK